MVWMPRSLVELGVEAWRSRRRRAPWRRVRRRWLAAKLASGSGGDGERADDLGESGAPERDERGGELGQAQQTLAQFAERSRTRVAQRDAGGDAASTSATPRSARRPRTRSVAASQRESGAACVRLLIRIDR